MQLQLIRNENNKEKEEHTAETMNRKDECIAEMKRQVSMFKRSLVMKDGAISNLKSSQQEKNNLIAQKDGCIAELIATLGKTNLRHINQKNDPDLFTIAQMQATINKQERRLEQKDTLITHLKESQKGLEDDVSSLINNIAVTKQTLGEVEVELDRSNVELKHKDEDATKIARKLKQNHDYITEMSLLINKRTAEIDQQNKRSAEMGQKIVEKDEHIIKLSDEMNQKNERLAQMSLQIVQKDERITKMSLQIVQNDERITKMSLLINEHIAVNQMKQKDQNIAYINYRIMSDQIAELRRQIEIKSVL